MTPLFDRLLRRLKSRLQVFDANMRYFGFSGVILSPAIAYGRIDCAILKIYWKGRRVVIGIDLGLSSEAFDQFCNDYENRFREDPLSYKAPGRYSRHQAPGEEERAT